MATVAERTLRLVRDRFAPQDVEPALDLLATYGDQPWEREVDRVHRAAVALSDGDLDRLRDAVGSALRDHRDVLMWSGEPPAPRSP